MSIRTLVELNHDHSPDLGNEKTMLAWAYMRSGDKEQLPRGVTFKHMRHHSAPDPMPEQNTYASPSKEPAAVCPFDGPTHLKPTDPCPICGQLGSLDEESAAVGDPSKCPPPVRRVIA
jgi:hypothetical protein